MLIGPNVMTQYCTKAWNDFKQYWTACSMQNIEGYHWWMGQKGWMDEFHTYLEQHPDWQDEDRAYVLGVRSMEQMFISFVKDFSQYWQDCISVPMPEYSLELTEDEWFEEFDHWLRGHPAWKNQSH